MKKKTIKARLAKTEKKLEKTKTKLSAAKSALKAAKKTKPATAKTTKNAAAKKAESKKPASKKPIAKKPAVKKVTAKKKTFKKKSPFVKPVAISIEELLPETNGTPLEVATSEPAPPSPIQSGSDEPNGSGEGEQSATA